MDFSLTEDRQMLSDTLTRFLADRYGIEHRNSVAYEAPYHDAALWSELSDLGIWGALVPEDRGGFGGTGADIAVVFEALGRALCPAPALGMAMAGAVLPQSDELIAGTPYAVALAPLTGGEEVEVKGDALTGRRSVVYGAPTAERFLIEADGALWDVAASDVQVTGYAVIEGGGAGEVMLDGAPGTRLGDPAAALQAGIVALCAEAVGVMEVLVATTNDYLKQRNQFGRAIGDFQALQHRMVDLTIEMDQARSITILAADSLGGPEAALHASMAKNLIGRVGKLIAEEAIQMHGGIAMTWEYPVSHYAKRLTMIGHQLGDADTHLERVMAA